MMDLSDNYTVLYSFMGRQLIDAFGLEGERALREGTRRFGRDRAEVTRAKHEALGVKINMKSLFSVDGDLPPDPRFRRELQELNPEERISHTLICPMADIWKAYGEREIGRIYCEEFHPACYNHYAFDCGHTNLGKTLTQEGDEYCSFNVVLRAQNMPEELRSRSFAEYDPGYIDPVVVPSKADGKSGFESLSIKLYYYIFEAAFEAFGGTAGTTVSLALLSMAADGAKRAQNTAEKYNLPFDAKVLNDSYPLSLDTASVANMWERYSAYGARELFEMCFVPAMKAELRKWQSARCSYLAPRI
ncbi:L-2-amino-thiazoline-4-carboxylic acid hydrolase [Pyramidobacter porci]|nr:L-2-amino-thiazoline-4-carboxylic acid hydrolase [Pyramidobacter porci]